jgi:hypothetical protein
MTELTDIDRAVQAATDPLTSAQRGTFTADMERAFRDVESVTTKHCSTALERAFQIASSKLFSDPLDPIGEAWARFASSLFTRTDS